MNLRIHPSVFIRGSLTFISVSLVIVVFFVQPIIISKSQAVHQKDQGTASEKEITPIDPKYRKALTTNHKLLIILISSNYSIKRVPQLMETWGNLFTQTRFSAGLFFEFIENSNTIYKSYKNIPFFEKYKKMMKDNNKTVKDLDLALKEINALEYFITNSTAEWLFRGVDDTFINMNEFPRFFTSLPDPTDKPIMYGDCIESETPFLHGGSGILLSREMAKLLLNKSDEWLKNVESPEENYFSKLIESAGFDVTDFASPYFMGLFNKNDRKLNEIPKCKSARKTNVKCPNFVSNIKKTVFFHDKYHQMSMENWTQLVDEGPVDLNWFHGKSQELFCF